MRKDCPTITPAGSRISVAASNKPPAARTFNMIVKDAVENHDVIAGTLLLNSTRANYLTLKLPDHSYLESLHAN